MSGSAEQANPLEMSDEEFLKINSAPPVTNDPTPEDPEPDPEEDEDPTDVEEEGQDPDEEEDPEPEGGEPEGEEDPDDSEGDEEEDEDDASEGEEEEGSEEPNGEGEDPTPEPKSKPRDKLKPKEKSKGKKEPKVEDSDNLSVDHAAFYEKVMAPFKANGKTIELKSPEEVIQLMQMGANYTKKLQDIQPHRKVLMMLQNNELLDEGKLSYLIDLNKKDPEAIRKLVKDSGIDPMDIDTEAESEYRGGNHGVSDEEAKFREVMEDISSTDSGKETLQTIQRDFDEASKDIIWQQPEVMSVIQEQRENGIYDQITTELNRLKTLGTIPATVSFLQAYKQVGDQLLEQGLLGPQDMSNPGAGDSVNTEVTPQKVGEGTRKAKPKAANGEKAKAAANRRATPRSSNTIVNPLELSDEEFMKLDSLKQRL